MNRNYKFLNKEGVYFVSFACVFWIDIFTRDEYFNKVVESIKFCINEKGMELFAYCIMTNHVHLIFRAKNQDPRDLLRSLKTFTSKELQKLISDNPQESRKAWLLWMMEKAGEKNSNVKNRQFWQQDNRPIELWTAEVSKQKLDYIHNNPVKAGFVKNPEDWKYSSATDYCGQKGILPISFLF